jgi:hypothetical protein
MNKYYISFPFRGDYIFAVLTANMLANKFIEANGASYDFTYEEDGQFYNKSFDSRNPETNLLEKCQFEFSYKNSDFVNVYYSDDSDEKIAGTIIERDIPWILLKVVDAEGKELYNINDDWDE